MFKEPSPEEQLDAIFEALDDSLLEASNEQIIEEASDTGGDVKETETRIKSVLRIAAKALMKKRLLEARIIYEKKTSPSKKHYLIPESFQEKTDLLIRVLKYQPRIKAVLTLQYRDFAELAEEDLDSCLDELAELGVLDDLLEEQ